MDRQTMGAAKKLNYKKVLRDLVPINALSEAHIGEVTKKAAIEDVRSGRYVFRKGDRDYQSVYLLEGTVELVGDGRRVVSTVEAGSEHALHPLAHKQPRQLSVRASGKVTVARIDSRLMDVLLTWDESAGYDVVEIDAHDDDEDWMTRMLQSQAFLQLPPSNIHQLLMRLESVNASAGDVVIRQGEEGEYFYIVKNGRLQVTRKASANGKEVLLAELGEGACFGEEALVSETKRNASVAMVSDGMLMRLSKDDFNELLRAPLVHETNFDKAQELVSNGAQLLDVRLPGEFENQAIKGSINLPLSALREQSADLDRNTTYIVCCDTGRRSSAGAFVLSQRGFNVYALINGLMDVPNEALTSQSTPELAGDKAQDAEIIPFDADHTSTADAVERKPVELTQPQPADTALIDKLRSQLQAREQQIDEQSQAAEREKGLLQADMDATKQALDASQSRFDAVEAEKKSLQEELKRLQQTLSQIQASADGRDGALRAELEQLTKRLDQQQQAHDKRSRELEQEVGQLRSDNQELGQHSRTAAGERDVAVRELEQVRHELASIQQQLSTQQGEASAQQESLQALLEQREHQLEEQNDRSQSLERQLGELDGSRKALQQQIESAAESASAGQSRTQELEAQLAANEQKRQELDQSLQDAAVREQSLQVRLEQAEQKIAADSERLQSEALAQQTELNERVAAVQVQLDDRDSQLQQQQSEREELEQRLKETQQSLEQAAERERQTAEKLEQGEGNSSHVQEALDQSIADADALRKQLDEAKQQVSELDSRLNSAEKEHASDIASLREALTRAQDERENVTREQTRLMGALSKVERDLERERQDNETEVHRLQRELKEAAGESNAGLAAELDALQEQLKQGARQRDDLEIQLGDRSAQMENAQAETEKLRRQLKQAQDSARQTEQKLTEANQAANEEMAIRLDSEQQLQQALREQLESVTSERNQKQEQLTVQSHELEELRDAVQQAQAEATANMHNAQAVQEAEQQVQELREVAQQLEKARDEARSLQRQAQQEVDQLRAEAEVSRGLVNMQASMGDSDEALHAELVEGKKNVELAVRLRIQAEEKAAGLQQEVDLLQLELSQYRALDSLDEQEVRVPSLDETEPQASVPLNPEFDAQQDDVPTPEGDEALPEQDAASVSPIELVTAETEKTGGSKILWIMLLAVVLAAAGAYWWFIQKPLSEAPAVSQEVSAEVVEAPRQEDVPTAVESPQQVETELQKEVPQDRSDKPKTLPSFARGLSESPIPASAEKSIKPQAAVPEVPAAKVEIQAEPVQTKQPLRSFREALKSGGTAPTVVEFRADSFEMGSSSASPNFAERPRHRVELKRFAIGKHEVTFAQYDQFAQASGRSKPASAGWGRGIRPVINVSWQDAVAYTRWLSEQTGSSYRLPTEAEWEFAARSGSDKRFWWGNKVGDANANCFDCGSEWSGSKTAPVGSFAASAFDVRDMAGNVMEWVQDCYRSGYAEAPDDGSAVEFAGCEERVVRGGGYDSPADLLRSASRSQRSAQLRLDNLGFRVVREF